MAFEVHYGICANGVSYIMQSLTSFPMPTHPSHVHISHKSNSTNLHSHLQITNDIIGKNKCSEVTVRGRFH